MFSSETAVGMLATTGALAWLTVIAALLAAVILLWFLIGKPSLTGPVKGLLFLGFGALPISAAMASNAASMGHMKTRQFCGSCHVMVPFTDDAASFKSDTLASRHSRNSAFGEASCYTCHRDYGMFGEVFTKIGGLQHVWHYYGEFKDLTVEEAIPKIDLYKPFTNENCMQCHSTHGKHWLGIKAHAGAVELVRANEVSCASVSCHGKPHPSSEVQFDPRVDALMKTPVTADAEDGGATTSADRKHREDESSEVDDDRDVDESDDSHEGGEHAH